jgi:hypothetical protein
MHPIVRLAVPSVCLLAMLLSPAVAQDKKEYIKITAEEITKELDKDSDGTFKKYLGKSLELSGEVLESQKFAAAADWLLVLKGVKRSDGKGFHLIRTSIKAGTPDFEKAKKLTVGKKVVLRADFQSSLGSTILLNNTTIVSP